MSGPAVHHESLDVESAAECRVERRITRKMIIVIIFTGLIGLTLLLWLYEPARQWALSLFRQPSATPAAVTATSPAPDTDADLEKIKQLRKEMAELAQQVKDEQDKSAKAQADASSAQAALAAATAAASSPATPTPVTVVTAPAPASPPVTVVTPAPVTTAAPSVILLGSIAQDQKEILRKQDIQIALQKETLTEVRGLRSDYTAGQALIAAEFSKVHSGIAATNATMAQVLSVSIDNQTQIARLATSQGEMRVELSGFAKKIAYFEQNQEAMRQEVRTLACRPVETRTVYVDRPVYYYVPTERVYYVHCGYSYFRYNHWYDSWGRYHYRWSVVETTTI